MDENEYRTYFEWKQTYYTVEYPSMQCRICQYLNESENKTKVYEYMDEFWNSDSNCTNPKVYYKDIKDFKL
jgi:hypothetical protein